MLQLRIPDPFLDCPPGMPQVLLTGMLIFAGVASGWIVLDTQRAMNWMATRGPEWWPGRAMGIRLAGKPWCGWLYRIDCAVVFIGVVLLLGSHWLKQ
jgi:hypothetical protein